MKPSVVLLAVAAVWAASATHVSIKAQGGATQTPPPAGARTVWDGVFTEAQATRGAAVYKATCARCHGDALAGKDDAAPLSGKEFMASYNGSPLSGMFTKIRTSMPDDEPGTLKPEETADVVAYILQFNKFPAGTDELPADTTRLKTIKFEATKPKSGSSYFLAFRSATCFW
jgi:mono/diheme cytochrome c family protein